jgi:hypothetical protein
MLAAGARFGSLFYVAAQALDRLPSALASTGGAAFVLVLPTAVGHRASVAPSFEVAGCRGYASRGRTAITGEQAA